MGFKIRDDYAEDDQIREVSMHSYQEHLNNLCQGKVVGGDLLKYFCWDFFHDGQIEEIAFRNGTAEVQMKIICPNIKRKTKTGISNTLMFLSFAYSKMSHISSLKEL